MTEWLANSMEWLLEFSNILNASIAASWMVLAVIVLRLLLKKAPRWIHVALWGLVAVRLLLPFSLESSFSLIPSVETVPQEILRVEGTQLQQPAHFDVVSNPIFSDGASVQVGQTIDRVQMHMVSMSFIWLFGIAVLLLYTAVSYWRLRRKVSEATILRDNIYQGETVASPFVLGIIRPRIYLPYNMSEQDLSHVVAHEQAHIRRKDYWWKPLGFLLLTIHWFNPLMWLAYVLLCRDIELACDEKVIKELGNEQRADYTQALVACSVNRRMIAACPLAFGEVGVKERVQSVLNYRKPAFWVIVVSVIACAVVAVCFLTNPAKDNSWIKATHEATSMELEYNLAPPIHSYAIYEDIYENGELISSEVIIFGSFQEEGGDSPRRTTLALNAQLVSDEEDGFSAELFLDFENTGIVHMARKLPKDHYTGSLYVAAEIGAGIFSKQKVATEDNVTLLTILLSTDPEGKVIVNNQNNTLVQSNDTVVIYRFVTSENGELFKTNNGANKPAQLGGSQTISLNDVIMLSQKGHDLNWSDFNQYRYIETGSGLYIRVYEINEMFSLWIGGTGPESEPMYIYLSLADDLDARIDIRDGGVTEFLQTHNGIDTTASILAIVDPTKNNDFNYDTAVEKIFEDENIEYFLSGLYSQYVIVHYTDGTQEDIITALNAGRATIADLDRFGVRYWAEPKVQNLDAAISAAILDRYASDEPDGLIHVESHMLLANEVMSGTPLFGKDAHAEKVTAYLLVHHVKYSTYGGTLAATGGGYGPTAITFKVSDTGEYILEEYWEPRDGSYYDDDIRDKFPGYCADDALNDQAYIENLKAETYNKALAYLNSTSGLDVRIAELLGEIQSSPSHSSNPGDYIRAHEAEYEELLGYGEYTLRYCFTEFLQGGQNDLRGRIMALACEDIMLAWGEALLIDGTAPVTGQEWFDIFCDNAASLSFQFSSEMLEKHYPASWLLLELINTKLERS